MDADQVCQRGDTRPQLAYHLPQLHHAYLDAL
jgi:hypothetical protein